MPLPQRRLHHMLHMPRPLVLHQTGLPFLQHPQQQAWHTLFVAELLHGREERFEIEDYGAREREAT